MRWKDKTMIDENLIKLAHRNLENFDKTSELAEYLAFLFSELSALDRDWEKTISADIAEMEG
jgi:hypothetical protein